MFCFFCFVNKQIIYRFVLYLYFLFLSFIKKSARFFCLILSWFYKMYLKNMAKRIWESLFVNFVSSKWKRISYSPSVFQRKKCSCSFCVLIFFFSLPLQKGQFFVFVVILGQVSHPRPRATLLTVFTRSCDFENRGKDN